MTTKKQKSRPIREQSYYLFSNLSSTEKSCSRSNKVITATAKKIAKLKILRIELF
jgi:hypothetical protein